MTTEQACFGSIQDLTIGSPLKHLLASGEDVDIQTAVHQFNLLSA